MSSPVMNATALTVKVRRPRPPVSVSTLRSTRANTCLSGSKERHARGAGPQCEVPKLREANENLSPSSRSSTRWPRPTRKASSSSSRWAQALGRAPGCRGTCALDLSVNTPPTLYFDQLDTAWPSVYRLEAQAAIIVSQPDGLVVTLADTVWLAYSGTFRPGPRTILTFMTDGFRLQTMISN